MKQRPFNLSRGWKTARNFVLLTVELLAALGVAWDLVWPEIDKLLAGLLPG